VGQISKDETSFVKVRFEALAVVKMAMLFWVMAPYRVVD
jgi:hypothetical protein